MARRHNMVHILGIIPISTPNNRHCSMRIRFTLLCCCCTALQTRMYPPQKVNNSSRHFASWVAQLATSKSKELTTLSQTTNSAMNGKTPSWHGLKNISKATMLGGSSWALNKADFQNILWTISLNNPTTKIQSLNKSN